MLVINAMRTVMDKIEIQRETVIEIQKQVQTLIVYYTARKNLKAITNAQKGIPMGMYSLQLLSQNAEYEMKASKMLARISNVKRSKSTSPRFNNLEKKKPPSSDSDDSGNTSLIENNSSKLYPASNTAQNVNIKRVAQSSESDKFGFNIRFNSLTETAFEKEGNCEMKSKQLLEADNGLENRIKSRIMKSKLHLSRIPIPRINFENPENLRNKSVDIPQTDEYKNNIFVTQKNLDLTASVGSQQQKSGVLSSEIMLAANAKEFYFATLIEISCNIHELEHFRPPSSEIGLWTESFFCAFGALLSASITGIISAEYNAKGAGIQNILALRGDPPHGHSDWKLIETGFAYAIDLYGNYFCIGVAGYPEGHIENPTVESDFIHFIEKAKLADYCVTQLFYDCDIYRNWVARVRAAGVNIPILPGIMPIQMYGGFKGMTSLSKTIVPPEINAALEPIKDNDKVVKEYGVKLSIEMCKKLQAAGQKR
ncbi:hypothetical protein HK100_009145 [Physocladia obscura]|uniref:Methylenetetrahydrofolate reductase (NAD(P)H) n=1 Tax=Physocladia obscura TaxID=109957 RepID=A0AAD5T4B4_9FUNG|nr:hypothetical protein HK100_009145 [Physocladia obscura]